MLKGLAKEYAEEEEMSRWAYEGTIPTGQIGRG